MAWGTFFVVLAVATSSARATCVFNSEFGFTLNCGFKKSSLFRVRNLGGVKGYVGLGFSVGDELGFAEALSNTDDSDQRRSTSDVQELQNLRSVAMSTGRSSGARSPQLSWNMSPAPVAGTAGALPGAGVVPPFKPLATKEAVVPPFSALPPSIARIPVIKPAPVPPPQVVFQPAPQPQPVFQAPLQQMANRRFQQVAPPVTEMPLKNSILVGSVEKLPSPVQEVSAPSLQRPAVRQTAASNNAASLASKTKLLQNALHHGTYDGFDLTSPSPLLMGHSLQSLSKASNISVEALAAALRLREQQLLAALTSTTTPATTTTATTTTTTTSRPTKPATVKPKYPMIGPSRVMNAPKEYYPVSYDQNYDDNFTSKVELPDTTFSCGDQKHFPGLYADEDLGCMVFHVCAFTDDGMVMKSFLCPESTLFDQSILKCNWWFYVDCKASKRLYDSNIPISKSYQLMKALAFFSAYKNQTSNNT